MKDRQRNLLRERKALLEQWAHAPQKERTDILIRIMDIDEQLELEKTKPHQQLPRRSVV
ncbi:MAG: hypothetical protein PWP65_607 [Clostridia bacterium]|nr:hypothetical protein [Clostridia bacterium]